MIATDETIDAVASSIHILDRDEAARLVRAVSPHYRYGCLTPAALLTACRLLYAGFDQYETGTKTALAREARAILFLGENTHTPHPERSSPPTHERNKPAQCRGARS